MKATVVSIVPFHVNRDFPGVHPSYYSVPASIDGEPQILVVKDGKNHMYVLDGKGITLSSPGEELAASIVKDFITTQLTYNEDAHPGLFFVEGEETVKSIKIKYASELAECKRKQDNWFMMLVRMADDDWQRYHQYKTISDLQRHAARSLKLEREWIDVVSENRKNCPACGIELRILTPICYNCKAILDPDKIKDIKFAVN